jgi:hypothetical protein
MGPCGRGTVPCARPCGGSRCPRGSPTSTVETMRGQTPAGRGTVLCARYCCGRRGRGPFHGTLREGHSPLCPILLRTAETPSLPTLQMGWGAFDLAIPGRGTVPRARSCGSSSRPGGAPSPAIEKIGPANARREGRSPLRPILLRTAGTPSLPDLSGLARAPGHRVWFQVPQRRPWSAFPCGPRGRGPSHGTLWEGHSPLCPHLSTDREDKLPLTCAVTPTAGRSPSSLTPWGLDRCLAGKHPRSPALGASPHAVRLRASRALCTSPCTLCTSGVHRNATATQSTPAKASRGLEAGVELEDGDALRLPLRLQVRTHPTTPTPLRSTMRATFQQTRDATPTPAMPSTEAMKTVILLPGAPPSAARHPGS